eukprot:scaffold60696_cov23-Prasinocladus_malaysianus.AAC.1
MEPRAPLQAIDTISTPAIPVATGGHQCLCMRHCMTWGGNCRCYHKYCILITVKHIKNGNRPILNVHANAYPKEFQAAITALGQGIGA